MSGCVNCVWDLYRDDMEAWSEASGEADRRLRAQEAGADIEVTSDSMTATADSKSVKLGVHEQRKVAAKDGFWDEELYRNVPVGIREFMKQEKRLKERHLREGTMGG
ncbi:hypothetical protein B0T17DRAFT_538635 [Bombardia bombarda]|uniref:Oxidoreductase-like domain-containing protein n=1 Tax=Bombardia bombarda TaxID=252184 RepID=A0AA39WHQ9_9PEZI|nr:hypothetical protein B0T17DRAFT_538635 [Bombardia bombarda]